MHRMVQLGKGVIFSFSETAPNSATYLRWQLLSTVEWNSTFNSLEYFCLTHRLCSLKQQPSGGLHSTPTQHLECFWMNSLEAVFQSNGYILWIILWRGKSPPFNHVRFSRAISLEPLFEDHKQPIWKVIRQWWLNTNTWSVVYCFWKVIPNSIITVIIFNFTSNIAFLMRTLNKS